MDKVDKALARTGTLTIAFLFGILLDRSGILDNTGALILLAGSLVVLVIAGPSSLKK